MLDQGVFLKMAGCYIHCSSLGHRWLDYTAAAWGITGRAIHIFPTNIASYFNFLHVPNQILRDQLHSLGD